MVLGKVLESQISSTRHRELVAGWHYRPPEMTTTPSTKMVGIDGMMRAGFRIAPFRDAGTHKCISHERPPIERAPLILLRYPTLKSQRGSDGMNAPTNAKWLILITGTDT